MESTKKLTVYQGPKYIILDKKYSKKIKKFNKNKNCIISCGGADKKNFLYKITKILINYKFNKIFVIIGKGVKKNDKVLKLKDKKFKLVKNSENLKKYFDKAQLAIVSGGTVMFEAIASGIFTLVIKNYDHQKYAINFFKNKNNITYLGSLKSIENSQLFKKNIINFLSKKHILNKNFFKNTRLIDGNGLQRTKKNFMSIYNKTQKKFKIICVLEARMNSSRLPGKVLKKLYNTSILEILINRLKNVNLVDKIVVSTSRNSMDSKIIKFCKNKKIDFFRGSEENVLERTFRTAIKYKPRMIIRLTCDNPFLDPEMLNYMIVFFLNRYKKIDYLCNNGLGNFQKRSVPFGLDIQIYKMSSFRKLYNLVMNTKNNNEYLEHPPLFFYTKGEKKFRNSNIKLPSKFLISKKIRVTVDTLADFKLAKKIFNYFKKKNKIFFTTKDLGLFFKKKINQKI